MYLLLDYLKNKEDSLAKVVLSITSAAKKIGSAIQVGDLGKAGTSNVYGEEQLALDVQSDHIIQEELKLSGVVKKIASEEQSEEIEIGAGKFIVAYDPLDGSSLVDVNLSVGSIFGVYEKDTFIGTRGDDQIAAIFIVYGPRTTMMITLKDGTREFTLTPEGEFILTKDNILLNKEGKMFAPGNLRATSAREDYVELMKYWMKEKYTLRYSGGMVPDINQILLKGKGVFTYPGYPDAPQGKLRLLFECNPMSLLVEQAQGKSTDGKMRILEKKVESLSQRTPIFIGKNEEVDIVEKYLK